MNQQTVETVLESVGIRLLMEGLKGDLLTTLSKLYPDARVSAEEVVGFIETGRGQCQNENIPKKIQDWALRAAISMVKNDAKEGGEPPEINGVKDYSSRIRGVLASYSDNVFTLAIFKSLKERYPDYYSEAALNLIETTIQDYPHYSNRELQNTFDILESEYLDRTDENGPKLKDAFLAANLDTVWKKGSLIVKEVKDKNEVPKVSNDWADVVDDNGDLIGSCTYCVTKQGHFGAYGFPQFWFLEKDGDLFIQLGMFLPEARGVLDMLRDSTNSGLMEINVFEDFSDFIFQHIDSKELAKKLVTHGHAELLSAFPAGAEVPWDSWTSFTKSDSDFIGYSFGVDDLEIDTDDVEEFIAKDLSIELFDSKISPRLIETVALKLSYNNLLDARLYALAEKHIPASQMDRLKATPSTTLIFTFGLAKLAPARSGDYDAFVQSTLKKLFELRGRYFSTVGNPRLRRGTNFVCLVSNQRYDFSYGERAGAILVVES